MEDSTLSRQAPRSPAETGSATRTSSSPAATATRGTRRTLRGTVIRDRMAKTITVRVERVFKHVKYGKYIRRHKQYHAHDEEGAARVGDEVEIRECRPLSKLKRWRLIAVLRKGELTDGGVA